jgi:hypothetical protein
MHFIHHYPLADINAEIHGIEGKQIEIPEPWRRDANAIIQDDEGGGC